MGKHGGKSLANSIENQQTGLLANLILHVFAPKVAQSDIANPFDAKAIVIGATRILCEAPDVLVNQGDPASWRALGAILVKLLRQIRGQSYTPNESFECVKEIALFHLHQLATQRPHFQPLVSTIQEQ